MLLRDGHLPVAPSIARRSLLAAALVFSALVPSTAANAALIEVTTSADEFGAETGCSLREAIAAANGDVPFGGCPAGAGADTIRVPAGTYTLAIGGVGENAGAKGDLDILAEVAIIGAGPAATVVDAAGLERAFHVDPEGAGGVDVTIAGLTVRNGTASAGGAIYNQGALVIEDCVLEGNVATPASGGAVRNTGAGSVLTVNGCVLRGNRAAGRGGGIFNEGTLSMASSTLEGNVAIGRAGGGGLHTREGSTSTVVNSTFSGNRAADHGGGIGVADGSVALNNVTLAGNVADDDQDDVGDGGGLRVRQGTVAIANTIVGNNRDRSGPGRSRPDCSANRPIVSRGHNLIEDDTGCGRTGPRTGDIIGQDPRLLALAGNGGFARTHALAGASPAVDRGDPGGPGSQGSACEPVDQRGVPRPQGPRCDIGSFELEAPSGAVCRGRPVTLTGTEGPDVLTGTAGPDVILALGGDDVVRAMGGNDVVCAGAGNDRVHGRGGRDILVGQAGRDRLRGGGGRDLLLGGPGADLLDGGPGVDRCRGGGRDRLRRCE